jgi:hypothetical protein
MQPLQRSPDPRLRSVVLLAVGVGGLALCITLVYLGMRAVMDIGGSCADGGPYVSARPCPDGVPAAMILGVFGLFLFGGLAMAGAAGTGGYGWIPLIAWTGLFATLGWNFLDYGLVHPPAGEGIEWGYVIPGVLFQLMAWIPVVVLVAGLRERRRWRAVSARGNGGVSSRREGAAPVDTRPPPVSSAHAIEVAGSAGGSGRREQLQAIDGLMASLVTGAAAEAPVHSPAGAGATPPATERAPSGADTQGLVDRLEQLGDMRERGLLTPHEYETAKAAVMRELEARA